MYRQLLEEHVVDGFIDNLPLAQALTVWYQHDGAAQILRCPYESVCSISDFFFLGFIKEKVHATTSLDVEDCKARITTIINIIIIIIIIGIMRSTTTEHFRSYS